MLFGKQNFENKFLNLAQHCTFFVCIKFLLSFILSRVFSYIQPVNIVSDHNIFVGAISS